MTTFFDALTGRRLQEAPANAWRIDDGNARSYVVGPAFFDPQVNGNVLIRIAVNEQAPISPTTFAVLGYQGVTGLAQVQLEGAGTALVEDPGAVGAAHLQAQRVRVPGRHPGDLHDRRRRAAEGHARGLA